MRTKAFPLLPIFRSELQARLLALLLLNPEERFSGPELQRRMGAPEATFRGEVGRLEAAGLVRSEMIGRTKLYTAAKNSPVFEPLAELVRRTVGVEAELQRCLEQIEGVEAAAIFGSWAAEEKIRPGSDVDLLVIGDADFDELADAVSEVEQLASREIHLVSYTREEFDQKLADGSGFAETVLKRPLKPLVGDVGTLMAGTA